MKKLLLLLLLTACVASVSAQPRRPRVRVEWGLLGGINIIDFSASDSKTDIKNKLGWQAGIVTAVDFGIFSIDPQILYVRQGLRIRPRGGKEVNLKSNSIDVPVLFSLRALKPLRIFAGPVFTVMNDCKQKSGEGLLNFSRVRPTMSYTAGVGVTLMRHLLLDVRYNGQFKGKDDVLLPDGSEVGRLKLHNFAVSVGYVF